MDENARINSIKESVDQYLRNIEESGIDEFFSPIDARFEAVNRIWRDLHIEGGRKTKWKWPCIGLSGPSFGGSANSETVWKDVRPEVDKPDNRYKLGSAGGSNRHLFIVIQGFQGPAYVSICHCEPPRAVPDLPSEISHLWLAAEEGAFVYVWLADSNGWQNLTDKVNGSA
ncbi:MAG: hypothetical protein OXB94_14010 [Nitrospira sp.]|nr:hypothetical protein [Nitrospira sp.]